MNTDFLFEMETFFMALADKTRLRLLNLLRNGEINVNFFTEVLGESQPKISRHLAYLRNAGIVASRRDGKWMHYRIIVPEDGHAAKVLRDTLCWLESQEIMRKDFQKLSVARLATVSTDATKQNPEANIFAKTNIYEDKDELEVFLL